MSDLARRMAAATRRRYGPADLPGSDVDSVVPAFIQSAVNEASPAWRRIDALVRADLGHPGPTASRGD